LEFDEDFSLGLVYLSPDGKRMTLIRYNGQHDQSKRIKSLCGAKPPQKLRWTNAGRWIAMGIMEILPRTLGGWADSRGSACASCVV
jgi:hypothetical protein